MGIVDILKVSSQCERYQMPFGVVEQTWVLNYRFFIETYIGDYRFWWKHTIM
jgi:hypothetical protein